MNSAQRIISKFGSQTALSEALERPQSTIQYWAKTGAIPKKWHSQILELAIQRGLDISPMELAAVHTQTVASPLQIPEARWPGTLEVGGIEIPCYVLDDTRSVITRTGALNYLTGGKGGGTLKVI